MRLLSNLEEVLKNFKGKYYIPNDDDEVDYEQLYEQQKQRADGLEEKLKETEKVALDRLIIISNFKDFLCESIDNAKEDCKKENLLSNRVWLRALQFVYVYAIKNREKDGE